MALQREEGSRDRDRRGPGLCFCSQMPASWAGSDWHWRTRPACVPASLLLPPFLQKPLSVNELLVLLGRTHQGCHTCKPCKYQHQSAGVPKGPPRCRTDHFLFLLLQRLILLLPLPGVHWQWMQPSISNPEVWKPDGFCSEKGNVKRFTGGTVTCFHHPQ